MLTWALSNSVFHWWKWNRMSLHWANVYLSHAQMVNFVHAEIKTGVKSYSMNVSQRGKGNPRRKKGNLFSNILQHIKEIKSHQTRGWGYSEHAFMEINVWEPGCCVHYSDRNLKSTSVIHACADAASQYITKVFIIVVVLFCKSDWNFFFCYGMSTIPKGQCSIYIYIYI